MPVVNWRFILIFSMRSAIFSSTIDVRNGYGNITYELCSALKARGVDITLFLPKSEREYVDKSSISFPIEYQLPPYIFRIRPHNFWPYLYGGAMMLLRNAYAAIWLSSN